MLRLTQSLNFRFLKQKKFLLEHLLVHGYTFQHICLQLLH